jgi:hypothetical protein
MMRDGKDFTAETGEGAEEAQSLCVTFAHSAAVKYK